MAGMSANNYINFRKSRVQGKESDQRLRGGSVHYDKGANFSKRRNNF